MNYLDSIINDTMHGRSNNFDPNTTTSLSYSRNDLDIGNSDKVIPKEIKQSGISDLVDIDNLGSKALKESSINEILDFGLFEKTVNIVNNDNKKTIGNNWASIPENKSSFNNELLLDAYNINKLLIDGRNNSITDWNNIRIHMVEMFRTLISINIKKNSELTLYSLMSANQKQFQENPSTQLEKFDTEFWDLFLIPLTLKQEQLLGIKATEFWMYLGFDIKDLIKDLQANT